VLEVPDECMGGATGMGGAGIGAGVLEWARGIGDNGPCCTATWWDIQWSWLVVSLQVVLLTLGGACVVWEHLDSAEVLLFVGVKYLM